MAGTLKIVLLAALFASLLSAAAVGEDYPHLNVIVRFSADLPLGLVTEAEKSATHVFDKARVTAQWLNCPARDGEFIEASCDAPPAPTDLVLHIVPGSERSNDAVFGVAFVTDSAGAYADIFDACSASTSRPGTFPSLRCWGRCSRMRSGTCFLASIRIRATD